MTTTMNALVLNSHGLADSAVYDTIAMPAPTPGTVLVKVHAAAFNRVDLHMRASGARIKHELPQVMGLDAAGEVVQSDGCGPVDFALGQKVVIYPQLYCGTCPWCEAGDQALCDNMRFIGEHCHGTMAEYVRVPIRNVFPMPEGLTFAEAACLPTAYLTAWRMVVPKAQTRPGDVVVIPGVGGGVAIAALQWSLMCGARVIVTSSTQEKLSRALEIGAHEAINYRTESNIARRVMDLTGRRGADVIINNVGGDTWGDSLKMAAKGARILTCGVTQGDQPPADLRRVFIRQLQILGSTHGSTTEFRRMLDAVQTWKLKPVIHAIYPLRDAVDGLNVLAAGTQFGKIVVDVSGRASRCD